MEEEAPTTSESSSEEIGIADNDDEDLDAENLVDVHVGDEPEDGEHVGEENGLDEESSLEDLRETGIRFPYDRSLSSAHQYLRLSRDDDSYSDYKQLAANTVISVTIIKLPIVMFPNQLLPFHASDDPSMRHLLNSTKTGALIALRPKYKANVHNIATLIQVVKVSTDARTGEISIHAMGRQRCQILKERSVLRCGDVKVLADEELMPFIPYDICRGFAKLKMPMRLAVYSHLTAHHDYVVKRRSTGLTAFSYWVAINIPVDTLIRLQLLEEPCADRRLVTEYSQLKRVDRIVCKYCGTVLCHMSEIISVSTEANSALYVNPTPVLTLRAYATHLCSGGYVHDMFTVSNLHSTHGYGAPTEGYSWFPGYKWTIQNCGRCHNFVGWLFESKSLEPDHFYGVTRSAVCPSGTRAAVNDDFFESFEEYIFLRNSERYGVPM
uniref:CULT domain-containing protein n=1 Tax=Syphacia muris TaxID=451379 RepID=A0A0N5AAP3_9BILA